MNAKKVLIVTYYWPPAGGPGVQRWLKFAKYLPGFGIEPIIYTPENPSYPILDESLLNEVSPGLKVIKTKIWEPYQMAEKLNPKSKQYKAGHFEPSQKQSLLTQVSVFIRGNFFIPDARKFWVKPSVRFLEKYLIENQIGTIVTTGPPHSMHLVGLKLKERCPNLKWLADFRDPWSQISYHSELKLTKSAQKKHRALEQKVLKRADAVIATSFTDAGNYKKSGAQKVETITNGFEESDFIQPGSEKGEGKNKKFKITYSGGLEAARNPQNLWKVLNELKTEHPEFAKDLQLEFVGNLSPEVEDSLQQFNLSDHLIKSGYVSHQKSIPFIQNSNLLLLSNFPNEKSKGIIPGKLFEYLATGNPVLAIGPEGGDVAKILDETKAGKYFTYKASSDLKYFILEVYHSSQTGNAVRFPAVEILNYSRKNLTEKLSRLIFSIS